MTLGLGDFWNRSTNPFTLAFLFQKPALKRPGGLVFPLPSRVSRLLA